MNKIAQHGNQCELIRAIEQYNLAAVQWLIRSPQCAINAADAGGHTPLHHACGNIFPECLKMLLQNGADPNLPDDRGQTPLHYASHLLDRADMVQSLLDYGANHTLADHVGQTALHVAANGGHATIIRLLIQNGAQIDTRDSRHRTPLHHAATSWKAAAVLALLEAGADPRAADAEGNTPLHLAATTNYPEITVAFLDAGANPDACNHAGQCPLELSVGRTSGWGVGAAVALLERGAATTQVMLDNLLKNTIRRAASIPNSCQLVETLLQRNASTAVLTKRDFLFLLAADKREIRWDKSIGLTQEAQGVLRLLAKHCVIPPWSVAELL